MKSTLLDHIKEAQEKDLEVQKWLEKVQKGETSDFNLGSNEILRFRNRIVVPKGWTKKGIFRKNSPYQVYGASRRK